MRWLLFTGLVLSVACTRLTPTEQAEVAFEAKQYEQAATLFTTALSAADDAARPRLHARLGQTLKLLGKLEAAEEHLQAAIASGDPATAALAQRYLGRLLADRGDFPGALAAYGEAQAWLEAHGPARDLINMQVHRAGLAWYEQEFETAWSAYIDVYHRAAAADEVLLRANALDGMAMMLGYAGEEKAADGLYAQAIQIYDAAGSTSAVARATAGRAIIALNGERIDDARGFADKALEIGVRNQIAEVVTQAKLLLAMIEVARERWDPALEALDEILAAEAPNPFMLEQARLVALRVLASAGRWDAFRKQAEGFAPQQIESQSTLATLRAREAHARGAAGERRRLLEEAVRLFEEVRAQLGVEQLGTVFTRERRETYEALIEILAEAGEADAALRLIGSIKARAFGEALRGGPQVEVPIGLPGPRVIQRARLRFKLAKIDPAADPTALRTQLPPDVAIVEYYALADRLLVFWIDREGVALRTATVQGGALESESAALLKGLRDAGVGYEEAAAKLGAWLLDPIAGQLNEAERIQTLVIVPHGVLHPIPFEALPWAGGLLVDRFGVVSAANLTAVQSALASAPNAGGLVALAVGDAEKNLPGARREAEEVVDRFQGRALLGSAAQESVVREAMRDKDLLHFAVHGVRPDATAPAYLALAADSSNDGKLHADELATETLRAALVVLSVCDSARGRPNQGDEIVGVIDRAFLRAGARSVVASRWPVHDAASVLFMRRFYEGLRAGRPILEAFHGAQLALRRKQARPAQLGPLLANLDGSRVRGYTLAEKKPLPQDFAHPYFWAAFSLRGAWR